MRDETIKKAGLGYNPTDRTEDWAVWGLEPRCGKKGVWLARGVVIPWEIDGILWRVNIRRPPSVLAKIKAHNTKLKQQFDAKEITKKMYEKGLWSDSKYIGPAGWGGGNPLYNAEALAIDKPALLVDGELDVLTAAQEAGDLVAPVATGSTSGARRARWIAFLALCSSILVTFDTDEPGEKAAHYWLNVLDNANRWRPYCKDVNAMIIDGFNLRKWLFVALGNC